MRLKISLVSILIATIPLIVFAQDVGKKKAYYFYGEQCPHCKKVDEYFKANGIYDRYEIQKLEVSSNPFNGKLLLEFGKAFGASDWGGVPTIIFGDKYLIGDQPIIDNFVKEIEATENANELPNPEKISQGLGNENSKTESNSAPEQSGNNSKEKKKDYFPVVIGALVVLGGGALIYINRNKKS
jgi:glutaredoxin